MLTPVLILATFDAGNAGQYGLVQRGVAFPIALISQAVAQVFSAEFAKSIRDNPHQSHDFFRRMVWVQLRLAIVPTLLLMWLGPWIFPVVFGAAWEQAGYICRVTSPLFLTSFVVGPVNMSLVIMRRLKAQAILDGFKFVAVVLLWTYIAQSKMDIISALKAHVVLSLLYYAAYLALTDMYLKADHGKREPDQPMPGNRTWDQSQNPG
jgi:O-antigen/teichoic acid export membrane protein